VFKVKQSAIVEGVFEIAPSRNRQLSGADSRVIVVCRAGRLFGGDPNGRVDTGVLRANAEHALREATSQRQVACERPPARRSLRAPARRTGAAVPIFGEIDPSARRQITTVLVNGRPVDIEITYVGPLPR
jgi:hypothetical protein